MELGKRKAVTVFRIGRGGGEPLRAHRIRESLRFWSREGAESNFHFIKASFCLQ